MRSRRQLGLPFPDLPATTQAVFLPGDCNAAARAWCRAPQDWPALRLAVFGEAGTGKSHFLRDFAAQHGAALLPGPGLSHWFPPPPAPMLAIDDADAVPDPRSLLHLLNHAAERGVPVLLAGTDPPATWHAELADLASRLRATQAVALLPPEDSLLKTLLVQLLSDHQLLVSETVQKFLSARLPRNGAALRDAATRLARATEGGQVTRRLASNVLEDMAQDSLEKIVSPPSPEPPLLL